MLRDITIGQYYPAESTIHRLDPRVKLLATIIFLISLFVNNTFTGYGFIILCYALVIKMSKVPFSYMLKGLKAIIFLLLFSVILNIFITDGEVICRFWIFKITIEGVRNAIFFAIRLVLLITGSALMTYTTTPTALTDGLEKSMGFLSVIHVPVHDFATMIGIALRFIPILSDEADKIIKAQEARGADFSSGGFIKKVKGMIPLLIPLLISAFRRAEDLALALDARCYNGGKQRTKLHPLKYKTRDKLAYLILFVYLGLVIVQRILYAHLGLL